MVGAALVPPLPLVPWSSPCGPGCLGFGDIPVRDLRLRSEVKTRTSVQEIAPGYQAYLAMMHRVPTPLMSLTGICHGAEPSLAASVCVVTY